MEKHRLQDHAFTRNRRLNFPTLMLYLLNLRKQSSQVELDQFFKTINNTSDVRQVITKSAFFQARKQLSETAFIALNHQLVDTLYSHPVHYKTWQGYRLCAMDGTSIRLPNERDITDHFGVQKGKSNQTDCPMTMASVFYDLQNKIVLDACIKPNDTSERLCAEEHLQFADKDDLIIYDRGYRAFWFYALHIKHHIAFCMRAKTNQDLVVKAFIKSGRKEAIITFKPGKSAIKTRHEKGLSTKPVTLRLVRVNLRNEVEVLMTNILDSASIHYSRFKSLYHQRWGIEENYKRLKQWVEIENFSGKSVLSVKQDFYAKIVALNLTALMTIAAQKVVVKGSRRHKLVYQVNFAQAVSAMKHTLVRLILLSGSDIAGFIQQTVKHISQSIEAVRAGRSAPRRLKNLMNGIHFPAYKNAL